MTTPIILTNENSQRGAALMAEKYPRIARDLSRILEGKWAGVDRMENCELSLMIADIYLMLGERGGFDGLRLGDFHLYQGQDGVLGAIIRVLHMNLKREVCPSGNIRRGGVDGRGCDCADCGDAYVGAVIRESFCDRRVR